MYIKHEHENERVTNKFLLFLFQVRNHPGEEAQKNSVIQCLEQGIYVFDLAVSHLINDRAVYHIVTLFMTPALRKVGEKRGSKTELLVEIILFYASLIMLAIILIITFSMKSSISPVHSSESRKSITIITFLSYNWLIYRRRIMQDMMLRQPRLI